MPCLVRVLLEQESSPMLYSLVFGEGVVNDATSIVLLRAVQKIRCTALLPTSQAGHSAPE
jgi:NhaP-type Na+/H+ or K+/H+ antiporter